MHIAAALGRHRIVEELFSRIPDAVEREKIIRQKDGNGNSYLYWAVQGLARGAELRSYKSVTRTIASLFHLGSIDHADKSGRTAYEFAQISGDQKLVAAFESARQLS
jgi:hypothetical protein